MVREGELQYWDPLTLDYMTEESDDDSDQSRIVEHKIPWRSSGKYTVLIMKHPNNENNHTPIPLTTIVLIIAHLHNLCI